MNFNELIEKAHSAARANGWWDEERNARELLMLIVSECSEALEAHRNGRMGSLDKFEAEIRPTMSMLHEGSVVDVPLFKAQAHMDSFVEHIKDSFSDELADIVIRIADFMGHQKWAYEEFDLALESDNVGESLYAVVSNITHHQRPLSVNLCYAVSLVFDLAKRHNIDLGRHVDLKLAYNATRGRKHNKLY